MSRKKIMMVIIGWTCIVILLFFAFVSSNNYTNSYQAGILDKSNLKSLKKIWTWSCQNQSCVRSKWVAGEPWGSLSECSMTCGPYLPIWPKPRGKTSYGRNVSTFSLDRISFNAHLDDGNSLNQMFTEAFDIFKINLAALVPRPVLNIVKMPDEIDLAVNAFLIEEFEFSQELSTNESYTLDVELLNLTIVGVDIRADNFFGVRNALETLSQLIWCDTDEQGNGVYKILNSVSIIDDPKYAYRGLMIDTARSFIPISALQRTIRGMAASKLNVLHLHLTDSQSFSFQSKRYPQMSSYGSISPDKVYSSQDLKNLTRYAKLRGVRLLPEMDAPSHAAFGWQWGEEHNLGPLAVCINAQPWRQYCGSPPCGQLNPSNNNTYKVLRGLYKDLIEMTEPTDMFHVGGDEVNENCWLSTPGVITVGGSQSNRDAVSSKLAEFHRRQLLELQVANRGRPFKYVIVWSVDELDEKILLSTYPKDKYVIQEWGASEWENTVKHLELGYRVILSHVNAWYLDCGSGAWMVSFNEACGPVTQWMAVYEHRPWGTRLVRYTKQILGGEACLWTEKTDEFLLDSRVWPRAAALAERLWTDPLGKVDRETMHRLTIHRERLMTRGLKPDVVQPQWCIDNPTGCL